MRTYVQQVQIYSLFLSRDRRVGGQGRTSTLVIRITTIIPIPVLTTHTNYMSATLCPNCRHTTSGTILSIFTILTLLNFLTAATFMMTCHLAHEAMISKATTSGDLGIFLIQRQLKTKSSFHIKYQREKLVNVFQMTLRQNHFGQLHQYHSYHNHYRHASSLNTPTTHSINHREESDLSKS